MTADDIRSGLSGQGANVLYREEQRFRQWWVWLIVVGVSVAVDVAFVSIFFRSAGPASGKPLSPMTYVAPMASVASSLLLIVLFYFMNLTTQVREDGLYVRFFPFHLSPRRIRLEDAVGCNAVTYNPIGDYGG